MFAKLYGLSLNAGSGTVNRMVAYNYLDSSSERPVWTTVLARTAWQDSAVFGKPHATEYDSSAEQRTSGCSHSFKVILMVLSHYYEHEKG